VSDLITVSDVRKITGEAAHIVNHAIARFGPEPACRIGITRVWRSEDLPRILESIERTRERSTSRQRRERTTAKEGTA
jgi:hypothetical protein